jgi:hypothetical protein
VKLLKSLSVRIASLNLPGKWRAKLDEENVEGLTAELQAGRLLPPIRIDSGRHVIQGFHRLAAHMATGAKQIRADIVQYDSDEEREVDVLAENLRRRQLPTEEYRAGLRRMVELFESTPADRAAIEDQLDAQMGGEPTSRDEVGFSSPDDQPPPERKEPNKGGRPTVPRRQAIKKTAALTGASESTVERAVKDEEPEPPVPTEIPACLDWFDLEPDRDVDGQARKVQVQVDEADKQLRSVRRLLTGLRELGLQNAVCDQLEANYDTLAHGVRRSRPKSACLYCKGRVRKDCYACGGLGWFTHHQYDGDLPGELRLRGDEAVVADGAGGYRLVLAGKPAPYKPAAAPVDANGNRVLTAEEAAERFGDAAESNEVPPGDPSTPFEPTPGQEVLISPGTAGESPKLARFVRFTKRGSVVVNVARVNGKGKYTGKWGDDRTIDRPDLLGPATGDEGLAF